MENPSDDKVTTSPFVVVCWNVLAHIHTHHNAAGHGGEAKTLEAQAQRTARHVRIVRALQRLAPDIALLQEVDTTFIPLDWQPNQGPLPCGERLDGYTPFRSYSDRGDGCAVLLRDAAFVRDREIETLYLPASRRFGHKAAVVVHARRTGASAPEPPIAIACVHLKWGKPAQQQALLRAVTEHMRAGCPAVLGGDFNTSVEDDPPGCWGGISEVLRSCGLERVATPAGVPTGLDSSLRWNASHVIDHLYATPALEPAGDIEVGPLPREGAQGPWGAAEDHDGSDHAWLEVTLTQKCCISH